MQRRKSCVIKYLALFNSSRLLNQCDPFCGGSEFVLAAIIFRVSMRGMMTLLWKVLLQGTLFHSMMSHALFIVNIRYFATVPISIRPKESFSLLKAWQCSRQPRTTELFIILRLYFHKYLPCSTFFSLHGLVSL